MPRAPLLSNEEKAVIFAHHHHGMSITEIATELSRSRDTISRFLRNPKPHIQKTWKPRNKKLSDLTVRRIVREATKTKKSAQQIKDEFGLCVSTQRIQQVLSSSGYLKYMKSIKVPSMTPQHKSKRVAFANEMLGIDHQDWRTVVFSDEKKFNLDGQDGLDCYWYDLRREPGLFATRQQKGDSIMVWGAISFFGTSNLIGISSSMDSEQYCDILEEHCLPWASETLGEHWVFQQDGASTHWSNYTKKFLNEKEVDLLPWPAKSPDLNIIENVWGLMARRVYEDGRQFKNVEELAEKMLESWLSISDDYLQKLYRSLPKRFMEVISRKSATIDY